MRKKKKEDMVDVIVKAAQGFGEDSFSIGDLTVAAWSLNPALLSIPGYKDLFPDTKRVHMRLYGHHGLIRHHKVIESLGNGRYKACPQEES